MKTVAVIGAGPAGLMAAEVMASAGLSVSVYEAKPSPARKFLMAGKSGLNVTLDGDQDRLFAGYDASALHPALEAFDNAAVRSWAEALGQETFVGTTGRVFPKAMKASPLLRAWLARLDGLGVTLHRRWRWTGWDADALVFDTINGQQRVTADVTVLACGGASWARLGSDGAWSEWIDTPHTPFVPSNVGLAVDWTPHMQPQFGGALKSVRWQAGDITSRGEAVLTPKGLEGGGVYTLSPAVRAGHSVTVDLMPDRTAVQIAALFSAKPKKAKLSQFLRNTLRLPPIKVALINECARAAAPQSPQAWAQILKGLPIPVTGVGTMEHAISTAGGVAFDGLDAGYMIKTRPGVFCAGEMLDWDAPTGGWLLSACFATGAWAGRHAVAYAG